MAKNQILVLILLFIAYALPAQSDVFTGFLNSKSFSNILELVETDDDFYYFGIRNIDAAANSISIFKTTPDFEEVNSIESLSIRDNEASLLSLLKIVNDRLLLVSTVEVDSKNYIFTHSLDLNLENPVVIDSIELDSYPEFKAREFKFLDDQTLYTFGNLSTNNTSFVHSANYFEMDLMGKIRRFEEVSGTTTFVTTFDYNLNTNQFFIAGVFGSFILDATFNVTSEFDELLSLPGGAYSFFPPLMASCEYVADTTIECVSSGSTEEFSNFLTVLNIEGGELQFSDAIPLHPDTLENRRTKLTIATRDDDENYYFAYHEPFNQNDNTITPNRIFISKFDKDFNNIYFLELLDENEHVFTNSIVDNNNNLIVIGVLTSQDNPNSIRNSYIKISDTGELLTSTKSIYQPEEIAIFPNPSADYITFKIDSIDEASYQIFSLDGKLKKQARVSSAGGQMKIDIQFLSEGMHVLNVYDGDIIHIAKIVKK